MSNVVEEEITFLREQVKTLRRTASAVQRQIDVCETRIDDLRRMQQKEEPK
jgi:prefoldin subunit 5